ncbi:hypothetical protein SD80_017635 [Scytonema tolypothrichoides VB-61278]|nr:hypothetical protein SD80_017635 [Scytonema tolypothrichoides VB-61278]
MEVEESEDTPAERVAFPSGRIVADAKQTFEDGIDKIKPKFASLTTKLKDLSPEEMEVKFGIKLNTEAGAILTSVGGEVNFEINVKWSKQ